MKVPADDDSEDYDSEDSEADSEGKDKSAELKATEKMEKERAEGRPGVQTRFQRSGQGNLLPEPRVALHYNTLQFIVGHCIALYRSNAHCIARDCHTCW